MKRTPMAHQELALEYAQSQVHPAFIMAMRLGKTFCVIRWVKSLGSKVKHVVVVAPLTVLEAWQRELTLEGEAYLDLTELKRDSRGKELNEARSLGHRIWILVNYKLLPRIKIGTLPWHVSILDESVEIKNPKAQITKRCNREFRDSSHRVILSGLPNPESELEIFSQFQFLDGHFMGFTNYWKFKKALFKPTPWNSYKWVPKPGARKRIKEALHKRAFVLQRSDVYEDRKVYQVRTVPMTVKQRQLYRKIVKDFAYQDPQGKWHETQWAMTAAMWLQRICGGFDPTGEEVLSREKVKEVLNILDELQGEQLVVWFKFRTELKMVLRTLKKKGIKCSVVHGGVKKTDRKEEIRNFRAGKTRVFLATEKCAKMGIDCSTADCEVYYSNEWSYDDRAQSEERIENPKKKAMLLVIDLATKGTIDMKAIRRIQEKGFNAKDLLKDYAKEVRRKAA